MDAGKFPKFYPSMYTLYWQIGYQTLLSLDCYWFSADNSRILLQNDEIWFTMVLLQYSQMNNPKGSRGCRLSPPPTWVQAKSISIADFVRKIWQLSLVMQAFLGHKLLSPPSKSILYAFRMVVLQYWILLKHKARYSNCLDECHVVRNTFLTSFMRP